MNIEGEPIRVIRETGRSFLKLNRRVHKDEITDAQRSIETMRITPELLTDISIRLKSKSKVSLSELNILKNSLIDDAKNIDLVLSTHGSLRGLVREITGTDVKRQCAAVGCCCNLALGNSKSCCAVAKAAGTYLVAALDSLSEELVVSCAWALGNMAGSGAAVSGLLAAAGAAAALARRARGAGAAGGAAVYALTHFAYQMKDDFSPDYLKDILQAFSEMEMTPESSQLLFILSCHSQLPTSFPKPLMQKILQAISVSQKHLTACSEIDECYDLIHILRTLANLSVNKENGDLIVNYFVEKNLCVDIHRVLLSENVFVRETLLWLLGNLYNCCGESSFFYDLACC